MVRGAIASICIASIAIACTSNSETRVSKPGQSGATAALAALGDLPDVVFKIDEHQPGCLPETDPASDANAERLLLDRIDRYASETHSNTDSLKAWFALYDDYRRLPAETRIEDPRTRSPLSVLSLVSVLPGPDTWPAMRTEAYRRAELNIADADARVSALGLSLMFDALVNDLDAQSETLDRLQTAISNATPARQEQARPLVAEWRKHLAIETGHYDPSAEMLEEIEARKPTDSCCMYLTQIVTKLGNQRARTLLEKLLFAKPIEFAFSDDDGTLELAQSIALENIDRLATVQWRLIDGNRAVEMLDALVALDCRRKSCASPPAEFASKLALAPRPVREALLPILIRNGSDDKAKLILANAEDADMVAYSLTDILERMVDTGDGDRAIEFMRSLLRADVASPYWRTLIGFGYATDKRYAGDAYRILAGAPIETKDLESARTTLSSNVVSRSKDNDVDGIAQRLKERARLTVAAGESNTGDPRLGRADAALDLAKLGLLEDRKDWLKDGIVITHSILDETRADSVGSDDYRGLFDRNSTIKSLVDILVESGQSGLAEEILLDELSAIGKECRRRGYADCNNHFASPHSGNDFSWPARLLVGLYARNESGADVRVLLDRYPFWPDGDATDLMFQNSCNCIDDPLLSLVDTLLKSGARDQATSMLWARLGNEEFASQAAAQRYIDVAGPAAIDRLANDYRLERGPRFATAAFAAAYAGELDRAAELASAARRETLYRHRRLSLAKLSTDIERKRGDTIAIDQWSKSAEALELAGRASRYRVVGATNRAREMLEQAKDLARPGDCIESAMLDLAHTLGERQWATTLVEDLARNARMDDSGASLGCLHDYLELTANEKAVMRTALLSESPSDSRYFATHRHELLFTLGDSCGKSANSDRADCLGRSRDDAQAAYESLKQQVNTTPNDVDLLERLASFVDRSDFSSLYAGHMDMSPERPTVSVPAAERDAWTTRGVALDPGALPRGIDRKGAFFRSSWSPVIHLEELWRAVHEGAEIAVSSAASSIYRLRGSIRFQHDTASAKETRQDTAEDRAGNAVASTEIMIMAARFIEPGKHDPCTNCI